MTFATHKELDPFSAELAEQDYREQEWSQLPMGTRSPLSKIPTPDLTRGTGLAAFMDCLIERRAYSLRSVRVFERSREKEMAA